MYKVGVVAVYLMYIKPFRPTESRVAFASIVKGGCNTDELKAQHRAKHYMN